MFSAVMPTKLLADLFGRLSLALSAGIGLRRAWRGETDRVPARHRASMEAVGRGLDAGQGISAALGAAGDAFPPLVRGLVEVGERTGHEPEVFRELSATLDHTVRTRRDLLAALVGPGLQLCVAILVVGFLIWVAGAIRDGDNRPVDILGLGLVGSAGLTWYFGAVAAVAVGVALCGRTALASWRRHGVVRTLLDRVPVLGRAARDSEAAWWCRVASLAAGTGLDIGRLAGLASQVAPGLSLDPRAVEERLRGGATFADTLRESRRFPRELVEAVAVGELTGSTAETLGRLAGRYDEDARRGFVASARAAGFLVWALVAVLIIIVIFRIFSFYVGAIQGALGGR